jgi:squalene synthase HpnC
VSTTRENFPVAMRVLPAGLRADLQAAYRFARHVDDVGDERPDDSTSQLRTIADDVRRLYDDRLVGTPEVAGLGRLRGRVPVDPWLALVDANLQDQKVDRYGSFEDLLDYCVLSANPVGHVVLHIVGQATPERLALSDRVCTALQLLEHWQDVGEDYRRGYVYLPAEDLRRFGVREGALAGDRAGAELTALIAFETDRAMAWLRSGAYLVSTLHGWARVAVSGYVNGGRAAGELLARSGYDPLREVRKPRPRDVAACWVRAAVRSPG